MKSDETFRFTDRDHAVLLQRENASRVACVDDPDFKPHLLCGMDVSYDGDSAYAAAVVWDIEHQVFVEKVVKKDKASVKYMPGLLGFREGPILIRTSRLLRTIPDVFLVDGQGLAHPRRFGMACQFGLAIEKPTVGVAKSLLYGKAKDEMIVDTAGDRVGTIITSVRGKRFYVSVGHRISLETASRLVSDCMIDGHPVPLRQAHFDSELSRRSKLL